ncbi:MAG: hypothetical protein JRG91_05295 [Deltaproteobacteria bacterium]|nr:hypothetical protein [Deltaproteobacteria bacterium]
MKSTAALSIALLIASLSSPALAQDEPPPETASTGETQESEDECVCKETYADVLEGGSARLTAWPIVSAAAAAGTALSLGFMIGSLKKEIRSDDGLDSIEMESTLMLMVPAMLSAGVLATGLALTSIGYGMKYEALRLHKRTGMPLEQFCYPAWRAQHEFGRRHAIIGTIFLSAGTEMLIVGLASDINSRLNPDPQFSSWAIGIIHALFGVLTMTVGIALIYKGRKIMRSALEMKDEDEASRVSFTFTPSGFVLVW